MDRVMLLVGIAFATTLLLTYIIVFRPALKRFAKLPRAERRARMKTALKETQWLGEADIHDFEISPPAERNPCNPTPGEVAWGSLSDDVHREESERGA